MLLLLISIPLFLSKVYYSYYFYIAVFNFTCVMFWVWEMSVKLILSFDFVSFSIFSLLFWASFYIAAPLSLASSCVLEVFSYTGGHIAEFIVKGRERMPVMEFSWWDLLKPLISLGWCQWIGSAIFIWGWIHQLNCHAILVS